MRRARLTAPAEDEVHLWSASLEVDHWALVRLSRILSDGERSRARRFRFAVDRERFIVARARLRQLLAAYLDMEPATIEFVADSSGKARLSSAVQPRLTFNVSHSRDLAVYAIGCDREVGVDVEYIRDAIPMDAIAHRHFTSGDRAALAALAPGERREAFFMYWTRYEAGLKVSGDGLGVSANARSRRSSVHTFFARAGFAAAVATAGNARAPAGSTKIEDVMRPAASQQVGQHILIG